MFCNSRDAPFWPGLGCSLSLARITAFSPFRQPAPRSRPRPRSCPPTRQRRRPSRRQSGNSGRADDRSHRQSQRHTRSHFRRLKLDIADLASLRNLPGLKNGSRPAPPRRSAAPHSSRWFGVRLRAPIEPERNAELVRTKQGFRSNVLENPLETHERTVHGVIDSSLFEAVARPARTTRPHSRSPRFRLGHRLRARHPARRHLHRHVRRDFAGRPVHQGRPGHRRLVRQSRQGVSRRELRRSRTAPRTTTRRKA